MKYSFRLATSPQLHFGPGKFSVLPSTINRFGSKILLVTGARSFVSSVHYEDFLDKAQTNNFIFEHFTVNGEPTPSVVDAAVKKFATFAPQVVVAIGGGSVMDAGKAISAMLPLDLPVKDYLEGVGSNAEHPGVKVPFIAIPTTAGTGSEATKNAVLSEVGENGYKKSLRHDNFVPNVAIIDPSFTVSCPPAVTAASGMDAFTQLLESYLSVEGNPVTDALAFEGLRHVSNCLRVAYQDGTNLSARTGMALASYLSGITLANAGLGLVHGFAGSIGGCFPIPHGEICSSLMPAVNKVTVRKLRSEGTNEEALVKYAMVGKMFSDAENKSADYHIDFLLHTIATWRGEMNIPRLKTAGIRSTDFEKIITATDNKNNPVALNRDEMMEILEMAS